MKAHPANKSLPPTREDRKQLLSQTAQTNPELLFKQFLKKPDISSQYRTLIGKELSEEIRTLLSDKEIANLSLLGIQVDFDINTCRQYYRIIPEFDQIKIKTNQIAIALAEKFTDLHFNCTFGKRPKESVLNLYTISEKIFFQIKSETSGFSRLVLEIMRNQFYAHLIYKIHQKTADFQAAEIYDAVTYLDSFWIKQFNQTFPGKYIMLSLNHITSTLNNLNYRNKFETLVGKSTSNNPQEESNRIREEIPEKINYIKGLSEYRKIERFSYQKGDESMTITNEELNSDSNIRDDLCSIHIKLEKDHEISIPKRVGNQLHIVSKTGHLDLSLEKASGEINIFGEFGFSIKELIPEEVYLKLKNLVYDLLINYLEQKEPDIDDLFLPTTPSVNSIQTETAEQTTQSLENTQEEANQELSQEEPEYLKYQKPTFYTTQQIDQQKTNTEAENEKREKRTIIKEVFVSKLRNLKGERLLQVLTKLFGQQPEENGTSHKIFTSPINGKRVSIPIHPGKSTSFPLLQAELEKANLHLSDLAQAMKILNIKKLQKI